MTRPEALRGFGPLGLLSFVLIVLGNFLFVPLSALLVLAWARGSATPWRELGFVRLRSWAWTLTLGILLGIALKLLMKSLVMPLLGADPINRAFHHLVGNRAALPGAIYLVVVGAGFGEETVFRGYLFERLGRLFGSGGVAKIAIVAITAVLFGLAHWSNQGLAGAEQATIVGLVVGGIFAVTGEIWLPMVIHAAFDLTALAIIHWNLETQVTHWLFK